jgi:presenilin-like A22 family membrane protease
MTEKKKNWLIASLAVFMLAVGIVIAITTGMDYVFVGAVVLFALFTTYFVGRLDKPGGDTGGDI